MKKMSINTVSPNKENPEKGVVKLPDNRYNDKQYRVEGVGETSIDTIIIADNKYSDVEIPEVFRNRDPHEKIGLTIIENIGEIEI